MNNSLFLMGIILSAIFISIYLYITIKSDQRVPQLGDAVTLFLSGNGVYAGVKVCYMGLYEQQCNMGDEKLYIILGGFAVIWVSIETIYKIIFDR